jgi:hypothetical protein
MILPFRKIDTTSTTWPFRLAAPISKSFATAPCRIIRPMGRVRLTGPYRYLIYVTPDYAIVEGLGRLGPRDRAKGDANQSTFWVTDLPFQIRTKEKNTQW